MAGNYLVIALAAQILRRKEPMKGGIPDVLQYPTLSPSPSSVVQVGTLPQYLGLWKAELLPSLCLIWLRVTIFS